jgi:O-antigen/teichoic acid export membrane protein
LYQHIYNFFLKGNSRTINTKKQIVYSFLVKSISVLVNLSLVPLILNYLDEERYGIWLTLSSIIGWASFFDLGLGNGLRNKLTEALAKDNEKLAKTYVSTTYAIIGSIFLLALLFFLLINPEINWQKILNTNKVESREITIVAAIIFSFFSFRFFFSLIGNILMAYQKISQTNLINALGNILALVIIYLLILKTEGSLIYLSLALSSAPVIVYIIYSIILFNTKYYHIRPSINCVDFSKTNDLLGLGFKFFFTQIVSIVIFSSTNVLIAHFSSQQMVVEYNLAFKYIFLINMVFSIMLSPFWSASSDAFYKNDFNWLRKSLKKLNKLSLFFSLIVILFALLSNYFYKIWIGQDVLVSKELTFSVAILSIVQILTSPSQIFINSVGKLKLGLIIYISQLTLFIPFSYILGNKYGGLGVIASIIIVEIPPFFFLYKQAKLIVNNNSEGIWNK